MSKTLTCYYIRLSEPKGKSGIEDFVRIGRTARGNRKGHAITFFHAERDKHQAGALCEILKSVGQEVPEELQAIVPRNQRRGSGGRNKSSQNQRNAQGRAARSEQRW